MLQINPKTILRKKQNSLIFENVIIIHQNRVSITGLGWAQILIIVRKNTKRLIKKIENHFAKVFVILNAKTHCFHEMGLRASSGPPQKNPSKSQKFFESLYYLLFKKFQNLDQEKSYPNS
jgi:hypothetical protein